MWDASAVIHWRSARFVEGRLSQVEAERMISEKPQALASAYREACYATLNGASPSETMHAMMRPFRQKTAGNKRRLTGQP